MHPYANIKQGNKNKNQAKPPFKDTSKNKADKNKGKNSLILFKNKNKAFLFGVRLQKQVK